MDQDTLCSGFIATSLPALTFLCAAAPTIIHIQTVAPQIPKPAVSGTSVKVTVSLLRGGPGGEELHLPVSLRGILRGCGSASRECCDERKKGRRRQGGRGRHDREEGEVMKGIRSQGDIDRSLSCPFLVPFISTNITPSICRRAPPSPRLLGGSKEQEPPPVITCECHESFPKRARGTRSLSVGPHNETQEAVRRNGSG